MVEDLKNERSVILNALSNPVQVSVSESDLNVIKSLKNDLSNINIPKEVTIINKKTFSTERVSDMIVLLVLALAIGIGVIGGLFGWYGYQRENNIIEIENQAELRGIEKGKKVGRTEILIELPKSSQDYIWKKHPDKEKIFWDY